MAQNGSKKGGKSGDELMRDDDKIYKYVYNTLIPKSSPEPITLRKF